MKINIIVALGDDFSIGNNDGSLPWVQKDDLKRFKELTNNGAVIMGRKTADSLKKPLPNRLNIVLTRNQYNRDGFHYVNTIQDVLEKVNDGKYKTLWVIGGAEIYKQFISFSDKLYITYVNVSPDSDVKYNPDLKKFVTLNESNHQKDENNQYDYRFVEYITLK